MISFVYFDVGGVVMRDFSGTDKWERCKREWGIVPEDDQRFDLFFDDCEDKACTGAEIDSFIPKLKEEFNAVFSDDFSIQNFFLERYERNESIWPIVEKAKSKYKVGLLTNMYPELLNGIYEKGLMPGTKFDIVVDSSLVHLRKPDKKIFELATERAGVPATEILYIENTMKHIESAKTLGWQTFHYDPAAIENSNAELLKFF